MNSRNGNQNAQEVVVDLLYLDLSVCTRCQNTETSLDDSLESILALLKNIGKTVQLNKIHIETEEQANSHQFLSSPTIRVNGKDIQMEVKESHCSSCSSLTEGASVDCRLWLYKGKEYTVPPKEMIVDGLLKEIYRNTKSRVSVNNSEYVLPENLTEYFEKKDKLCANISNNESSCGDSNSCC